jgi:hypothetical protein
MKTTLLAITALVALAACDRPAHIVVEKAPMIVYHAEKRDSLAGYEYWINDATKRGWVLITDKQFQLGDTVVCTNSRPEK